MELGYGLLYWDLSEGSTSLMDTSRFNSGADAACIQHKQ